MVQVISATVFLVLLARLLHLPAKSWRVIVLGAVLVLAGSQLLPVGTPLREDVRDSFVPLVWTALIALPVFGYVLLLRNIRRQTLSHDEGDRPARPKGLVLIPDDAALVRDTEAALARDGAGAGDRVSVAWRDDAGNVAGHVCFRTRYTFADIELLWVAPEARRQGIGGRLIEQAETEARLRGATEMLAAVGSDAAAQFLVRHGFRPYAAAGARRHLRKPL